MNNFSCYNTNKSSSRGMKYSIGKKQVKVFIMKKFLIFIFTIFGLMVGWIAFMVYSYERSYNEWKSSRSGSKVTYPVENYASSSDGNKDYFESSNNKYEQNSSSSTLDEDIPDNLIPYVKEARSMLKYFTYSKQSCKESLMRRYKLSEDDAQYVVDKLDIDWKEQALLEAKGYLRSPFSKEKLVWQLINMEKFTQEEANYAIENVVADWKEEAVKMAEAYSKVAKLTKERVFELLINVDKFTQEEAEYAIEHAKIDWLN